MKAFDNRQFLDDVRRKIDAALVTFVRINYVGWNCQTPEAWRKKFDIEAESLIAAAREGCGDQALIDLVRQNDLLRDSFNQTQEMIP